MPDDRFSDLDPQRRGERPGAADRLSELDTSDERERAHREQESAAAPRRGGPRYAWIVGVVALILVLVAAVNSLIVGGPGEGFRGPPPGQPLPEFAAPTATSDLTGDANPIQREDASPDDEVPPACSVHGAGVVNVCPPALRPAVVTFVTTGCEDQLDVVERVRGEYPGVRFVGVYSDEDRAEVARLVEARGWDFEIAYDPDRPELFNLYRLGDCPETVLAQADGDVVETISDSIDDDRLRAELEQLTAAGADRAGAPLAQ